jgi:hypothetical protein
MFTRANPLVEYFCLYSSSSYKIRMINLVPADSTNVQIYWQNVLKHSIHPPNDNPMDDDNGSRFDRAQGNSDVLFFPGNDAQDHTRNIRPVPFNKRLFFAVNPVIITDDEVKNEPNLPDKDLSNNAEKDESTASRAKLTITINGKKEKDEDLIDPKYKVPTGDFEVTFPSSGGRWGVSGGKHHAAADGYYAIIDTPLERGDYKIEIDAVVDEPFPFKQTGPWTSKVTYNFGVVGPQ